MIEDRERYGSRARASGVLSAYAMCVGIRGTYSLKSGRLWIELGSVAQWWSFEAKNPKRLMMIYLPANSKPVNFEGALCRPFYWANDPCPNSESIFLLLFFFWSEFRKHYHYNFTHQIFYFYFWLKVCVLSYFDTNDIRERDFDFWLDVSVFSCFSFNFDDCVLNLVIVFVLETS